MLNGQKWPVFDPAKCRDAQVEIAVQVCGKIKARVIVDADCSDDQALVAAARPEVARAIEARQSWKSDLVKRHKLVDIVAR